MSLDQLMALTVNPDHPRQEQVWEALQRSYAKEPHQIRRLLTEGAVRASDKRAQFVGIEAYEAAGGVILRDLFNSDDGGWLQDPGLLDRLVTEKLEREADAVRAEGWKWIEVAPDFPYGHTYDLRRLIGEQRPLTEEEMASQEALRAEFDQLEADLRRGERDSGGGRPAAVRDRDRAGGVRRAPGHLRPGRDRPRRRLRQHRRVGRPTGRTRLCPAGRRHPRWRRPMTARMAGATRPGTGVASGVAYDADPATAVEAEPEPAEEDEGVAADPRPARHRTHRLPHACAARRARLRTPTSLSSRRFTRCA